MAMRQFPAYGSLPRTALRAWAPVNRTRDTSLWFEDGTIVLATSDSMFKVYRGALTQRARVFEDLLSSTRIAEAGVLDGVPVIELDDRSSDLAVFLTAIQDLS